MTCEINFFLLFLLWWNEHIYNLSNKKCATDRPPLTIGPELEEGNTGSRFLFYFNIKGSTHKKDVKLVAFCDGFQYLNDETQSWEFIKKPETDLPLQFFGCDFWVCCLKRNLSVPVLGCATDFNCFLFSHITKL